jgi:hypothetical protein
MASRICSECPNPLTGKGPHTKTCSPKCRSARSRRLKRQKAEAGAASAATPAAQELAARVRGETRDVLHKVIEEEVRPVVRESITEDTLRAIGQMVGLTGAAVAAIADDLASDDATIRQRAYSLVMKYTVGHGAIVTPIEQDKTQPINVHFQLPRPPAIEGEVVLEDEPPEPGEISDAVVVKVCDTCGQEKSPDEMAAASTRCLDCYAKQKARAAALLKDYDGD